MPFPLPLFVFFILFYQWNPSKPKVAPMAAGSSDGETGFVASGEEGFIDDDEAFHVDNEDLETYRPHVPPVKLEDEAVWQIIGFAINV